MLIAFFAGSAVFLAVHGLHLVRAGALDDTSFEYHRTLFQMNAVNALRRRPAQESLTARQIRAFGCIYIGVSPLCLLVALLGAAGVLG